VQSVKFLKETEYKSTFRTEQICGIYDLSPEKKLKKEFDFEINLDFDWQIGIIVGTSGAGKTSLAKKLFQNNYIKDHVWKSNTSFVNEFPKEISIKEITKCLANVGFSSPPLWLLPYSALSTGQQFRVDIVRSLLQNKELVCFDEFTSVVDRNVAKIGSHCVQKFVRKTKKQFVAVSCHYDIIDWLQPDWVFDVNANKLTRGSAKRPEIEFKIYPTSTKTWEMFKQYHYLDTKINKSSQCFIGYVWDKPVCFGSVIHFPHPKINNAKKAHRTVVLPDYQGISLGNKMSDFCAKYYTEKGFNYYSTTSQPAMIYYRNKSPNWLIIRNLSHMYGETRTSTIKTLVNSFSTKRLTASFKYINKKN
jgi:ABC-type dipeptide/oligopeptide/nickel transport system ATPase subunit